MSEWVRKASLWFTVIFVIAYAVLGYTYLFDMAKAIDVKDIKSQINTLITISLALFALVGAWIALVFPTALSKISNPNVELAYSEVDVDVIVRLLKVLIFSVLTLISVLLLDFALTAVKKEIFSKDELYLAFKSCCMLSVWFLYFVQIKSMIRIVASASVLLFELLGRKKSNDLTQLNKRQELKR